ncbi:MAG: T9SS type A sorting domain-containing protein, partial [Candidatus Symbiothrix sp.]|nr:T9SS type A sorting domain-containing protein [Candidatus Symbiothrix sp.]
HYWDNYGQPAGDWKTLDYDDSAWKIGNAPLGYGNFTKNTTIGYGNNSDNKYSTAYFRKTITLNNWDDMSDFRLTCNVDDGVAIYVNGRELGRLNLPAGNLAFGTYATNANNGIGGEWPVPANYLQEGENVITAEVHQCNASSSDLIFELQLYCKKAIVSDITTATSKVYSVNLTNNFSLKAIYEEGISTINSMDDSSVRVFPTVFDHSIRIENAANQSLRLYDLTGKLYLETVAASDDFQLQPSNLPSGMYLLKVGNAVFKIVRK